MREQRKGLGLPAMPTRAGSPMLGSVHVAVVVRRQEPVGCGDVRQQLSGGGEKTSARADVAVPDESSA
jgi:hypothetical protein